MAKKETIIVQGTVITVLAERNENYLSLTDMLKAKDGEFFISDYWLRNRNTVEFLGIWEEINNPNCNRMEFHTIKNAIICRKD